MPRVTAAARRTSLAAGGLVFGFIDLDGELLGTTTDDLFVALYADGRTVRMLDRQVTPPAPPPPPPVPPQTRASVELAGGAGRAGRPLPRHRARQRPAGAQQPAPRVAVP